MFLPGRMAYEFDTELGLLGLTSWVNLGNWDLDGPWFISQVVTVIELDYGKNYRKVLYLMVKTMVSG